MPCLPPHWLWWASNESQIRGCGGRGVEMENKLVPCFKRDPGRWLWGRDACSAHQ